MEENFNQSFANKKEWGFRLGRKNFGDDDGGKLET